MKNKEGELIDIVTYDQLYGSSVTISVVEKNGKREFFRSKSATSHSGLYSHPASGPEIVPYWVAATSCFGEMDTDDFFQFFPESKKDFEASIKLAAWEGCNFDRAFDYFSYFMIGFKVDKFADFHAGDGDEK